MRQRILFLVFLIFTIASPAYAQTFGAQRFTLENGLEVVVIPNHRAPVVTHMLWVRAGGADNLSGQSGMAHYLEHLLFKGTQKLAPGEYSRTVKTLGGNDNAFTGQDFTAFFATLSVDNLPRLMEMESDRMMNLTVPEDHYQSEKAVVLEERRQRTENDPRALFGEQMNAALYTNHPYGTPIIGWMSEIEKYQWPDVKAYYDRWYAPNNMILVVSGDITAEQLKPLAEKYYGAWPRKDVPPRIRSEIPPAIGNTVMTLEHPSIHQPMVEQARLAPSESRNRTDSLALQVLAEILDGGPTTRLYQALAVQEKLATSVYFSYSANALDYATIRIGGTPAEGVDVKTLTNALKAEIAKVVQSGVTDVEVREAISRLQDEAVFARDSIAGPAMIFGQVLSTGGRVEDVENWATDIAKITAADIQRVAKTYLNDNEPWIRPPVEGYLLPAPPEPASDTEQSEEQEAADVE